jgi:hypothetical protein
MFCSRNQAENHTNWQIGKVQSLLRGEFQALPLFLSYLQVKKQEYLGS